MTLKLRKTRPTKRTREARSLNPGNPRSFLTLKETDPSVRIYWTPPIRAWIKYAKVDPILLGGRSPDAVSITCSPTAAPMPRTGHYVEIQNEIYIIQEVNWSSTEIHIKLMRVTPKILKKVIDSAKSKTI